MRNVFASFTALFLAFGAATTAQAVTVTFDDLPESVSPTEFTVPNGYGGLNWSNFYYVDVNSISNSGYANGMVSPTNVAYNGFGDPAFASDSRFTLNSAYFTGAWNDGLDIHVVGSLGGVTVYTTDFLVNSTSPTLYTFNWAGLDNVAFSSSGGTDHGYGGSGTQFAMDNLRINEPVPEPSTLLLLTAGPSPCSPTLGESDEGRHSVNLLNANCRRCR